MKPIRSIASSHLVATGAWLTSTSPSVALAGDAPGAAHGHRPHGASARLSVEGVDLPLDAGDARHLLVRTGFAPTTAEVTPYVGLTRGEAVARVLASSRTEALTPLPSWTADTPASRAQRATWTPDQRRDEQRLRREHYDELRAWWLHEMLVTPSPFTERMTLFWHNHFTSGQDKVRDPQLMAAQNALLRRNALGRFGELLHAVAKDPAMLLYLDGASNRKGKPNENFAREVMELFTLGEGQYTQRDVTEAARAYTGWGVDPDTWRYVWRPGQHDDGEKTVLGHSGAFDGDEVIDILLGEPQTASFIASKLWREFVSDTPDNDELRTVAQALRASGYDIGVGIRALLLTPAFWNERNRGVMVSSPVEFIVGTVRRFDVAYGDTMPFARTAASLGEKLFDPPNVKGWPGGLMWINSSTLLARKQFVGQLFRATEPTRANRPGTMMKADAQMGAHPRAAQGSMRFDLDAWLAQFGVNADDVPGLTAQLRIQHAVLPLEPVDAIAAGSNARAYLEALLMDPVYQLK
ncbi:DUF1800 domain-containing protein [Paraburkholderia dinghuensis]|uniref:DUF1800 domain-containing protein n=1 Tax=Paraburkholderia dinghuensis TaxID=2305225 RepID=A0A3N6N8V8_9BURK|nr:DUF1800 domain-containing protein [Paraburkholderia dinghuensis]RQH07371.1 DUF1800 domain-containing protein [Paraburkholderia dinghuensis]